jgi:type II secretory ATPase GspE/PulE/Tfp pilus assembly ATPase PilB-like protein
LLNLGVRPVILAPALAVVIAQRLVRKLCQKCKKEIKLEPSLSKRVEQILGSTPKTSGVEIPKELKFYQGPGCAACNNIGYQGRLGVFEVFVVDDKMEQLVYKEASTVEIRKVAIEQGMITMIQDGLLKALEGITDVAEVLRVTEE